MTAPARQPFVQRDLRRLFAPKSIAVIGGGAWAESVAGACRALGFDGPVWPVHPKRETVAGLPALRRIEDLPAAPDAAMITINRKATVEAVGVLSQMGAGGAVCFASGFAEAAVELPDGPQLQFDLLKAAGAMPILGPNCYGFLNAMDGAGLWPDIHGLVPVERGVAILTQSSNIALNLTMQRRGLPIAAMLTCGNGAQIGMAELATALAEDDRTTAIGLHIEGIGDIPAFEAMAHAAARTGTPIVALKAGLTTAGGAAGLSHSASLAGSGSGAKALFKRLGIARVETLPELLETLKVLHVFGPLRDNSLVTISCSGGEAGLMADAVADRDLYLPELEHSQKARLREVLGSAVALANPLDYHTYIWNDLPAMSETFAAMTSQTPGAALVVVDYPRADRCDASSWSPVIEAAEAASKQTGTPIGLVASLHENLPEETALDAMSRGLAPLNGFAEALVAIEAAAWLAHAPPSEVPVLGPGNARGEARLLTESAAKELLATYGLSVPRAKVATGSAAAASSAEEIGFPVALKGIGAAHKTEAGLVALNLISGAEVATAAEAMPADEFLVEQMITDGLVELLIGVQRDPAHGYLLTLGAGGTLTEILQDSVTLLLPATESALRKALSGLRIAPLLQGYRGGPGICQRSLFQAINAVSAFAEAHPGTLEEVEVNPLICGRDFAIAADALIRLREEPEV